MKMQLVGGVRKQTQGRAGESAEIMTEEKDAERQQVYTHELKQRRRRNKRRRFTEKQGWDGGRDIAHIAEYNEG